jgi:hypothetical protein
MMMDTMEEKEFNELEAKAKALFAGLKSNPPGPSPYLKTRVLAELREKKERKKSLFVWKVSALFSTGLCALLLFVFMGTPAGKPTLVAEIGSPQAIRLDLESGGEWAIAEVEIILPNGVKFYSKAFPEMGDHKSFRLAFQGNQKTKTLPLVIQALEKGKRTLLIKMYDQSGELKKIEELNIDFGEGSHV